MIESEDLHEMEIPNSLRERTWSQGFLLWNSRPSCNQTCPNNCMVRITWSLWLVQSGQRVVLSWCAAHVNRLEWSPLGPDISWITPISNHLSKTDGWGRDPVLIHLSRFQLLVSTFNAYVGGFLFYVYRYFSLRLCWGSIVCRSNLY